MTETGGMKVYELAKELGIDSISLLDKLKGLKINVKNHMSELRSEEADLARSSLLRKSASVVGTTAKKAATRTTASKTTTTKTNASKTRKSTATATPAHTEAPPPEKKAASPIIRRRVKADGATETVSHGISSGAMAHPGAEGEGYGADAHLEGEATEQHDAYATHVEEQLEGEVAATAEALPPHAETPAAFADYGGMAASPGGVAGYEPQTPRVPLPPGAQPPARNGNEAPAGPATTGAPRARVGGTGAVAAGPAQPQVTTPGVGAKPPVPPIVRPQAPIRKSILKIVEPTPPPPPRIIKPAPAPGTSPIKPAIRPGTGAPGDRDNFRVFKMTKENLDQMAEEEAAKKRGGGREAEIKPEDVRFADYRKKEMVFLPKKKKIPVGKEIRKTKITEAAAHKRVVHMEETIAVSDLANQLSVKGVDVVRKLMGMGQMATINQSIDFDTATLVATEYGYEVRNTTFKEDDFLKQDEDKPEQLQWRPPVVTIMGHVDHGKTTLLDSIREANVAGGEAGGITQHIGAYTVEKNGKLITFIDTPGHEAFTVMRARGANVTDIVILVVSADDGVMPQTREALSHAQAAKVPIIVAVNKIDKPGANPEKIKQGLAELNLLAEDWGGETMFVPVSALKRTNIDKLLDAILLQSEVLDLKANPEALATGTVLEARLEKGRGPVVSVLVSRGTLRVGDPIVSGPVAGKVRALMDDKGRNVKEVPPGVATEVLGFDGVPNAGVKFNATRDDSGARQIAEARVDKNRAKAASSTKVSLDDLFAKIQAGNVKELEVVLKADVFGSVEAIRDSLQKLSTEKVKVKVIHAATGGITESDVLLASASENAIIIGFNVRPETKARQIAEAEHVEVKTYTIIYELLDDIKLSMTGLLDKKKVEKFLGRAEVRQIFSVPKVGVIAGSSVIDGKIVRGANVRLLRESRVIFEGKMSSLRRFKDDAKEVATGFECGIGIENYNDLKPGDVIEAFQIELVTPELTG